MISHYFVLWTLIGSISAWESYELDLFDLVEELGTTTNFYQFIGLDQSASVTEIKKAYRKLSLQWHPDKSDEPNAEQKFRHLVAVYEVLKDEKRRARYDRVLVEGLPRWHQPLYYFRRARKLRFWEIFTILTAIATIGHYVVLWAIYFESSLTRVNERSNDMRKRLEKKLKKSNKTKDIDQNLIEEEMARVIPALEQPQLTDILPIRCANSLVENQFFLPHFKRLISKLASSRQQQPSVVLVSSSEDDTPSTTRSPTVRMNDIVPEMAANRQAPIVSYVTTLSSADNAQPQESLDPNRPWSDEEKQLLCKTIIRFPPGAARRWEKIAEVIDRSVNQVTDMAKQIQRTVGSGGAQQTDLAFTPTEINSNLITEREQCDDTVEWSQTDQHLLECALKTVPKDAPGVDRWEQIARCIPGKTRDECLSRYRYIVQLVKAKKMA